ncbi:MAG TPA: hypothetical protein VGW98_02730 [Solirubrobacteraceae bacterium]|jgi:hypothetical protein|nr:hypothetical protein [Solirubrobacteraceae bacterium]
MNADVEHRCDGQRPAYIAPRRATTFVVDEYCESPAGITRHWQDTTENWPEMSSAPPAWFAKATIVTLHNGTVVQAL